MPTNPIKKRFSYSVKDFFGFYKQYKKSIGEGVPVDYKKYKAIMEDFFSEVMRRIISGWSFRFPFKMGIIYVARINEKEKKHKFLLNYSETKKRGKTVRFISNRTGQIFFKFKWEKNVARFVNKPFYVFTPIAKTKGVGRKGLADYIVKISEDPSAQSYIKK